MFEGFFCLGVGAILLYLYSQENDDLLFKLVWLFSGLSFLVIGAWLQATPLFASIAIGMGIVTICVFLVYAYRIARAKGRR